MEQRWDNMGLGLPPAEPEELETIEFEGKNFLVAPDTKEYRERLELDHLRARLLMGVAPVVPPSPPDNVNWERFQTPTRNQGDRGTCWAFGAIAAMEARYRRQYNLQLDLSEHYFFHLSRSTVLRPDYLTPTQRWENASSFWWGGGNSTSISALANLAATEEVSSPYQSQAELNTLRESLGLSDLNNPTQEELDQLEWDDRLIPRAARWSGRHRTNQWTSVAYDIDSLERQIAAGNEVLLDITVKWRFDAATDTYATDNSSAGGGHLVLLVGYDRSDQLFRIKNSWGEGRVVNLTYDFVRQHSLGAAVLNSVHPVGAPDRRQWWLGRWNMDHDGWRGALVIRRFADQGAPTKLGNYYRDGNSFDVNGFMAQDGLRASFAIAPTPGKKTPGDMTGQRFDAYVFSWDRPSAAGVTTWNGVKFGAQLSRDRLPAFRPEVFDIGKWVGVWDMNHDGWRGTLTIDRIDPVPLVGSVARLRYHDGNGVERQAGGIILQGLPHQMNLSITFDGPPQIFALYAHTWERGFFSGTTVWGNGTFGVIGRKRG